MSRPESASGPERRPMNRARARLLPLLTTTLLLALEAPALLVAQAPAGEDDAAAAEAIERCVAALGGQAAWRAIETLELTGRHTSFSHTRPFVLRRKRPDLYRFDHNETSFPLTVAFDGETAWWHTGQPLFSKASWPAEMPRPYLAGTAAEAELEPPFIDPDAKGHRIEWLGESRFEGQLFEELRVTRRADPENVERWFLDLESHMPVLRMSRAAYHGYLTEQITYFEDYREVAGVLIPHRVETELGNDLMIMEVERVKVNLPIDDQVFRRPLPAGMERLAPLAGRWRVAIESLDDPTVHPERLAAWERDETVSTIRAHFGGSLLEEEITVTTDRPRRASRRWSYDRFSDVFRLVHFDTFTEHLDVLEGRPDDEGRLVLSNRETGTAVRLHQQTLHAREVLHHVQADSFRLDREVSVDGGETWGPEIRFTYTRIAEQDLPARP
ncbi:MAG: DUF1579 domain-containing protein [bacterium]|nr:DUF1579 domain-containing protein [bacterium]